MKRLIVLLLFSPVVIVGMAIGTVSYLVCDLVRCGWDRGSAVADWLCETALDKK